MKKTLFLGALCIIALILTVSSALAAGTLPVRVREATINNIYVEPDRNDTVVLKAGSHAEIEFEFWSTKYLHDVQVEAFLAGHSATPVERRTAALTLDEMEESVIYEKRLTVKIPEDISPGDYVMMLHFSDDEASLEREYEVEVTRPDHGITVRTISITPEGTLKAGRTIGVQAEVYNFGRYYETVTVSARIPGLDSEQQTTSLSVAPYSSKYSNSLYFTLPVCTPAGRYTLNGIVEYADGLKRDVFMHSFDVMDNPDCGLTTPGGYDNGEIIIGHNGDRTILTVPPPQDAQKGGEPAVYNIMITNDGKWRRSYYLETSGIDWAWSSASPSNLVVLEPGQSVTIALALTAKDSTETGTRVFSVDVKSGDRLLKQLTLGANVLADPTQSIGTDPAMTGVTANVIKRSPAKRVNLGTVAEVATTLLVTAIVIAVAVFYFARLNGSDKESREVFDRRYYRRLFRKELDEEP